jgi:L-ribulokinase
MFSIFGTSSNYMLISDEYKIIPGICGVVKDGLIPGYNAYEAGLCCFGDHFAWVAENVAGAEYIKEAEERDISTLKLLIEKASVKKPGEAGLIALNWWNGNRSVLVDSDLSGMILGMDLRTKPEDIMRAIIEANAFGTRLIIETYEESGVKVNRLIAAGGIPKKDPFTMQLFADVLKKDITIASASQIPAVGCAVYAAAAAGMELSEAMKNMSKVSSTVYSPNPESAAVYDKIYAEYKRLFDYFGRGENNVMKTLKAIREKAFAGYQVNAELLSVAHEGCMVQHCLPAHRGEEITEEIFEAHADEIFDEAENRLHAQKAVLVACMK